MAFKTPKPYFDEQLVKEIEEHLELDCLTKIETSTRGVEGIAFTFAVGVYKKSFARPMFQVLSDGHPLRDALSVAPCACYDFHRSWNCPDHPELEWDWNSRTWKKPPRQDVLPPITFSLSELVQANRQTAEPPATFRPLDVHRLLGRSADVTVRLEGFFTEGSVEFLGEGES